LVHCNLNAAGNDKSNDAIVGREIRDAFESNHDILTPRDLTHITYLEGEGPSSSSSSPSCCHHHHIFSSTVRRYDDIDAYLKCIIESIRGKELLTSLELIDLGIGRNGCNALASLLRNDGCGSHSEKGELCYNNNSNNNKCNLVSIDLARDYTLDDECAIILAEALKYNTKLESLTFPTRNAAITKQGWSAFSKALCDTSSINDIYCSNHTMKYLGHRAPPSAIVSGSRSGSRGRSLFPFTRLDNCKDGALQKRAKQKVAMKKILRHHPHLNMDAFLLEWDMKMLPTVVTWLDRAKQVLICDDAAATIEEDNNVQQRRRSVEVRKLDVIYQFLHAMPEIVTDSDQGRREPLFVREVKCSSTVRSDLGIVWKVLGVC